MSILQFQQIKKQKSKSSSRSTVLTDSIPIFVFNVAVASLPISCMLRESNWSERDFSTSPIFGTLLILLAWLWTTSSFACSCVTNISTEHISNKAMFRPSALLQCSSCGSRYSIGSDSSLAMPTMSGLSCRLYLIQVNSCFWFSLFWFPSETLFLLHQEKAKFTRRNTSEFNLLIQLCLCTTLVPWETSTLILT